MSELSPYTISPAEGGGYTWPANNTDRKIKLVNNLAKNGDKREVELDWIGQDGPFRLPDLPDVRSLDNVAYLLFGKEKEAVLADAKEAWEPYVSKGEGEASRVIISGATDQINAYGGEIYYLQETGSVIGINASIESRELALANPGDIAFINSSASKSIAQKREDIQVHEIGKGFLNYNSHRWLYKALECIGEEEPSDREIQLISNHLAQNPETVVQVYMPDEESEMLFLYLRDNVNKIRKDMGLEPIEKLKIDANSAEISKKLANKGHLYPTPEVAKELVPTVNTYESWLEAEGAASPIEQEMNIKTPRMPGYNVVWEENYDKFAQTVHDSIDLLQDRWGSNVNFFKHVEGSDGAGAFRIDSEESRDEIIKKLYNEGHSWVVEPFVNYRKMEIKGKGINQLRSVAPSVHVRGGNGYDTKLAQVMISEVDENGEIKETSEWGGHVHAPRNYADEQFEHGKSVLGMTQEEYDSGLDTINAMTDFYGPQGFSRGGIDMAVGTIETKWGEKNVNALQDMNIRTNGGDTARGFGNLMERELGVDKPFTTLVIKPNSGMTYEDVDSAIYESVQELGLNPEWVKLLTAVAPGWGMFGMVADSPEQSFVDALTLEERLREKGVIR